MSDSIDFRQPGERDVKPDRFEDINVAEILVAHDKNCRGKIIPFEVITLSESILRDGLLQPITVQPYQDPTNPKIKWRVIAGNRRVMAHRVAKLTTIKAIIRDDVDDAQFARLNLIENTQRVDLNIKQEAQGLKEYIDWGWKDKEIAEWVGESVSWVVTRKILLTLPEDIQEMAAAKMITHEQIKQLKGKSETAMYEAVKAFKTAKINYENMKVKDNTPKVKDITKKERQSVSNIFDMQMLLYNYMGASIATRAMAWCAGEINDYQLMKDLELWCEQHPDKPQYKIPANLLPEHLKPKPE